MNGALSAIAFVGIVLVIVLAHVVDIWGALALSAILWAVYALVVRAQRRAEQ